MHSGPISSSQVDQLKREVQNLTHDIERKKLQLQKDEHAFKDMEATIKKLKDTEIKLESEIKKKQTELKDLTTTRTQHENELKLNGRKHINERAAIGALEHKLLSLKQQVEELSKELQASSVRVNRLR